MVLLDPGPRSPIERKIYVGTGGVIGEEKDMTMDLEILPPTGWTIEGASLSGGKVTFRLRKDDKNPTGNTCQNCGVVVAAWDEHTKYRVVNGKVIMRWRC